MIALGDIEDVGRRTGMGLSIIAVGALAGPPISGAIYDSTRGFKAVGYYAGMFQQFESKRAYQYFFCRQCGCIICYSNDDQPPVAFEAILGKFLMVRVSLRVSVIIHGLYIAI